MKTSVRRVRWGIALAAALVLTTVATSAVQNWATGDALGQVAVSFNTETLLLDSADPNPAAPVDTITVTGGAGLAFDAYLNLILAKTNLDASGELVKFGPLHPHATVGSSIPTQSSPSALAIAADGTIYVASRSLTSGARAVITRIPPAGSATQFNIIADTTTCIGIDLDANQKDLWVVTGGRTVKRVIDANSASGDTAASPFTTLPDNNGTACGLRLLAPPDLRETPAPPLDLVRLVVADGKNVKLVTSRPGQTPQVVEYDAGNGTKRWIDVAVDPVAPTGAHLADVWAVDAGSWHLAKFRLGTTPSTVLVRDLPGEPRGVAVNGELRVAQTVGLVTVNTTSRQFVTFWPQNTATMFTWAGLRLGTAGTTDFAIQAFEVRHDVATGGTPDVNTGLCVPSLNIRCRLVTNFSDATPKIMSRGRSAVTREILRSTPTTDTFRISVEYRDLTSSAGGPVCTPGVVPKTTAMARDPWDTGPPMPGKTHDVFSDDAALAFYGGDDGTTTIRKTNDTIVVDRTTPAVKYNLRVINPATGTTIQVKRSLPISVEVTDPFANCGVVPNLNDFLIFTVTDVTTSPGTPVGDTLGLVGAPLTSNGHPFAFSANLYRTQLYIDPKRFPVGHTFRLCPQIPSNTLNNGAVEQEFPAPLANEACVNFNTIK